MIELCIVIGRTLSELEVATSYASINQLFERYFRGSDLFLPSVARSGLTIHLQELVQCHTNQTSRSHIFLLAICFLTCICDACHKSPPSRRPATVPGGESSHRIRARISLSKCPIFDSRAISRSVCSARFANM